MERIKDVNRLLDRESVSPRLIVEGPLQSWPPHIVILDDWVGRTRLPINHHRVRLSDR